MKVPDCGGSYEPGHETCDGKKGEKPCAWRISCMQLRDYCRKENLDPEEIIKGKTIQEIDVLLDIEPPKPEETKEKEEIGVKDPIPEECYDLLDHFENQLRDRFGSRRVRNLLKSGDPRRVIFTPGIFYPIDRMASRQIIWLCKAEKDFDHAVAVLELRTISKTLDAQIPFDIETLQRYFSDVTLAKFVFRDYADGQFKTIAKHLDRERIGIMVWMMKRLADEKVFLVDGGRE
jgi:hypothetical protein